MALPPKGDVRRPLHLAVRSTRLLGILFVLFGTCTLGSLFYGLAGVRGGVGGAGQPEVVAMTAASAVYFTPGVLFILFSIFLKQRKTWAVVGAIVLSSLCVLLLLIGMFGLVMAASVADMPPAVFFITAGVVTFVALALGQLIYHLARSFQAIKQPPFGEEERGFEPLPARQVVTQRPAPAGVPTHGPEKSGPPSA
jgi:hypothetical protein